MASAPGSRLPGESVDTDFWGSENIYTTNDADLKSPRFETNAKRWSSTSQPVGHHRTPNVVVVLVRMKIRDTLLLPVL